VTQPQTSERQRGESAAHIVFGLVAVLVAAVFGGVSYVSASTDGLRPETSSVRKAVGPGVSVASSAAKESGFVMR
jgi:hypothetical protein